MRPEVPIAECGPSRSGSALAVSSTRSRTRALGLALLALPALLACGSRAEPIVPLMLTQSLASAEAEWLEGWEQPRPPFKQTGDASFDQYRGSQLSLPVTLPRDAMLRGRARIFGSHDRRAPLFPILGEVKVFLLRESGEVVPILELPFTVPGDSVGFAINRDLSELAGEQVSLVLRLDAGESEPTRRAIQRRLRLAWSDLRVEGRGTGRPAEQP